MTLSISEAPLYSLPPESFRAAEGIAYSSEGLLAVAELYGDQVTILSNGQVLGRVCGRHIFEPHDVAFSKEGRLLAIANRGSSTVTVHERTSFATYSNRPRRILRWPGLVGTTAVAFESAGYAGIIAVNHSGRVTCFDWDNTIAWELAGEECAFSMPDGIAISPDSGLLAVAQNKSHEVTLYAREGRGYAPSPVARLRGLRHPHSMAFTPDSRGLIVTNSGGPNISVFGRVGAGWQSLPLMEWPACSYETFLETHYKTFIASGRALACEGGPKGLALCGQRIAWSGPNIGVREHEIKFERSFEG